MRLAHRTVRGAGRMLMKRSERERLERIQYGDAGRGYDVFGMHRDWLPLGLGLLDPLYRAYFRVRSYGTEHIPANGSSDTK